MYDLPNFNPPTPWGVGLKTRLRHFYNTAISLHPLRGEWDRQHAIGHGGRMISIHPLRGEWDCAVSTVTTAANDFNPPTPWGVGRIPNTRLLSP